MKNISVFAFLVIMLFISAANPVYCEDSSKSYGFSIEPQLGFIFGQAYEVVYPGPDYHGKLLSELRWDMKPVFYLGFKADFGRRDPMSAPGFFSSLSFKIGLPFDSGKMEDRDWLSFENSALTNFSRHLNKTRAMYWTDFAAGASFPVKSFLYIKPFLSFSWMHFAFTGRNGYFKYARDLGSHKYASINDDPDYDSWKGDIIRYQQDWLLGAIGFSIGTNILFPFSFEFSFQISPLTYCYARDDHLHPRKKVVYQDYSLFGLFVEPRIKASYSLNKIIFSLEGAYRYIGLTRGSAYDRSSGSDYFNKEGEGGAGLSILDVRFLVKYQF